MSQRCHIVTDDLSPAHAESLQQLGATIVGHIHILPAYSVTISDENLAKLEAQPPSWIKRIHRARPLDPNPPADPSPCKHE